MLVHFLIWTLIKHVFTKIIHKTEHKFWII